MKFDKTKHSSLPALTSKEKAVLEFIEMSLQERELSPSYQEIKDHFGFASFNSVQNYLKQLSGKGYIHLPGGNNKRAIQLLASAQDFSEHIRQVTKSSPSTPLATRSPRPELLQSREEILSLPLMGRVAAGQPIEAFDHDEFIDVPPAMVRNPSRTFALKVEGQSMIEDGIFDSDIILVQEQTFASDGEIVVAIIDNEATVKRYYAKSKKEKPPQEGFIELRPANATMKSMWYSPDVVEIRGVVVGLMRKF
ncbi:MAG: transcriptional repressor LexA [Pseudobdellovibrionaceae bacterium]